MSDLLTPLLQAGEGYHTEFKQSLDKSFVEEACAFANSGGDRIRLGVADNGIIKGIDTGIMRIRQSVAEHGGTELELRYNDFFTVTLRAKVSERTKREVEAQSGAQSNEILMLLSGADVSAEEAMP